MGLIAEASILVGHQSYSASSREQQRSMEPALHEMGIAGYLDEVRTGETRADMSRHGQVLPRGIEIGMSVPPARTFSGKQQVTRQGAGYPMHTECCYQPSGKGIYYVI
ncbi:Uncharacterized protein DBV15_12361 [Temnothorax longispinosus]|uniref:Uncharacterized protein n=1 Tax=Temnothorax longispinosus TaxID=300112 RepID=A0A4V3SA65_9HYME|nr:Uncharacterized protein DBV15_12361 [Temnothorax longispinosus]